MVDYLSVVVDAALQKFLLISYNTGRNLTALTCPRTPVSLEMLGGRVCTTGLSS
jgi:hypothetical protein